MIQNGKSITDPMNEYHLRIFDNEVGGCFKISQVFIGCNILYKLFLKGKVNGLPYLYLRADKLIFGIFSDFFIGDMKKEIKFSV